MPGLVAAFLPVGVVPMIIGEIRRYLRDNNAIRVSRSVRDTAYKALQMRESLQNRLGREPTVPEIARELQKDPAEVRQALDAIQDTVSLYEPVFRDGGDALYVMDQVRDEKEGEGEWVDRLALDKAMSRLGEREQHILALRFFEGKTQMEVSAEIGISQAQVSRLEKNALRQMQKYM